MVTGVSHSEKLTAELMKKGLRALAEKLPNPLTLVIGGGSAMMLAHKFNLSTSDIDAIPKGMTVSELDKLVKEVAKEEGLAFDWLNPYFSTFSYTLPNDYGDRLINVFEHKKLTALALGKNEMLIMKCFAHRPKDVGHARALIKAGADIDVVMTHLEELDKKSIPGAKLAIKFLEELEE